MKTHLSVNLGYVLPHFVMPLTADQKFEVLKIEMQILQAALDKYDNLAIYTRNWSVTAWAAGTGLAITQASHGIHLLAMAVSIFALYAEGAIRNLYWKKYVERYRRIRNAINHQSFDIVTFPVYDLTDKILRGTTTRSHELQLYLRHEHAIIYIFTIVASLLLFFIQNK